MNEAEVHLFVDAEMPYYFILESVYVEIIIPFSILDLGLKSRKRIMLSNAL